MAVFKDDRVSSGESGVYSHNSRTPVTAALRWTSVPAFLLLASCATTEPYPDRWAKLEQDSRVGECPLIVGTYREYGQSATGCQKYQKRCSQLSYVLLSGGVGYKEYFSEGYPDWTGFNHAQVRLSQPMESTLEIEMLDNEGRTLHRQTLGMENGDFTCDGRSLNLKSRGISAVFGGSNLVGSISRNFFRSSDGSLIMKSDQSALFHHIIIVFPTSESAWVRWPSVK